MRSKFITRLWTLSLRKRKRFGCLRLSCRDAPPLKTCEPFHVPTLKVCTLFCNMPSRLGFSAIVQSSGSLARAGVSLSRRTSRSIRNISNPSIALWFGWSQATSPRRILGMLSRPENTSLSGRAWSWGALLLDYLSTISLGSHRLASGEFSDIFIFQGSRTSISKTGLSAQTKSSNKPRTRKWFRSLEFPRSQWT